MKYDEETGIFEDSISIHPNMNSLILREFSKPHLQKLILTNSFFGEMMTDVEMKTLSRDVDSFNRIEMDNAAISIVSLREEGESLKIGFKFLDTGFAQTVRAEYERSPQSFIFRVRGISLNAGHMPQFMLTTFDMIFSPISNKHRRNRR